LEGEGAIRGACPKCHLLLEIFLAHRRLISLMQQVKDGAQGRIATDQLRDRQLDLFGTEPNAE
jgi:hypothetical protein